MSSNDSTTLSPKILPTILAIVVITIACLVLLGWNLDLPLLTSFQPDLPVMTVNTAVTLILAAAALLLHNNPTSANAKFRRRLALVLSVGVLAIALITLSQYLFGWELGIDQLLFRYQTVQSATTIPGRLSPHTAVTFLFTGLALIFLYKDTVWRSTAIHLLALTAAFIPLIALIGYSYHISSLFSIDSYTGMAIPTALCFLCLAAGLLTLHPNEGLIGILTSNNLGGMMSRRLLLAAILIPMLVGWITILSQNAGLLNIQFQFAFLALLSTYAFSGAILWFAQSLNQIEVRQQEAETQFQKTVESSPIAILQVDENGNIQLVNRQTEILFGYSRNEMVGQPIEMLVPESLRTGHKNYRDNYLNEASARPMGAGRDLHGRHKNGRQIPIEIGLSPLIHHGQTFILASIIDITERKQAESEIQELLRREKDTRQNVVELNKRLEQRVRDRTRQLEMANRELEAFSYSVSHDLRAPLRSIDGFSQALLEDFSSDLDSTAQHYLNRVRAGSQKMAGLIDNLLMLSRLSRTQMSLQPVNLSQMAEKIMNDLRESEPERTVQFATQPDIMILADPRLIEIALTNLISNAWKFTSKTEEPFIEFGAKNQPDGSCTYFVRDNGAGFDMHYANKLFKPFQRLHYESEFPGTGIGLATVQRILSRHSGTIQAQGTPNEGAVFYFSINAQNNDKPNE